MTLNSVLQHSGVKALQSPSRTDAAAASGHVGLAKIRGQSHHEACRGLSQSLNWRDARTLGLGKLARGLPPGA